MENVENRKTKLMVVEDQKAVALAMEYDLKGMGYEVTKIVRDGKDVVKEIEENRPDLILMDIVLEGETDGIDAVKEIQRNYDIPVVYLTGHANDEIFERAKLTGPFGFLIKPFEARELNVTIKAALYKHSTEKELKRYKHEFEKTQLMLAENRKVGDKLISSEHVNEHIRKLHRVVEQNPAIVIITDKNGAIEYT